MKAIECILVKENYWKQWRQVNGSTQKPRGGVAVLVKVPLEGEGFQEFETKDGLFLEVSKHSSERFCLPFTAPCYSGKLFDDTGFIGDTFASQQILDGTYVYPPDTDSTTKFLLGEASRTYKVMSGAEIATYVTVANFQYHWQQANGYISSSYIGLHMGLYKTTSFDKHLSALHTSKLSLAANMGVSLAQ